MKSATKVIVSRWSKVAVAAALALSPLLVKNGRAADTKPDAKKDAPAVEAPKAPEKKPDESKLPHPSPSDPANWKVEVLLEKGVKGREIQVPSVVCQTPDGRLLVAEDPMDQFGPGNKPIDRILCVWPDGRKTVFADKLYAVFGIAYVDGKVHVHHSPKYTVFTDDPTTGVGKDPVVIYDTDNPATWGGGNLNDHIPAQVRLGMDGWMYMSVGDKGIYGLVSNIDKSKAELKGGGVIRFRPDGTNFEVFATGTRNHLDISMNAEDEIFSYDNTDDGLGWWTRFTHMVDGGFYGYPYDFRAHESEPEGMAAWRAQKDALSKAKADYDKRLKDAKTDEEKAKVALTKPSPLPPPFRGYTLWAMDDFSGGSPCGATAYNEDALPPEYRGNLFHSEWGKQALERFVVERVGSTYRIVKRDEKFLKGGTQQFRPLGVVVSNDGLSFYVCDWNYSGWNSKTDAGRLIKMTYTGKSHATPKPAWWQKAAEGDKVAEVPTEELVAVLRHPAQNVRLVAQRRAGERGQSAIDPLVALLKDRSAPPHARWSAVWTLDRISGGAAGRAAIVSLVTDAGEDVSVRMQAAKQLGERKAKEAVPALTAALGDPDAGLRFKAATALGRIGDPAAVPALIARLDEQDLFARYAAFTAIGRIAKTSPTAWEPVVNALSSENERVREGATYAMREAFAAELVNGLAAYAAETGNPSAGRAAAVSALAPLTKQQKPWTGKWWGTQPQKSLPPAREVEWSATPTAQAALKKALADNDAAVRLAAITGLQVVPDQSAAEALVKLYQSDQDARTRKGVLRALSAAKSPEAGPLTVAILKDPASAANKELLADALTLAVTLRGPGMIDALAGIVGRADLPADVVISAIEALAKTRDAKAVAALAGAMSHKEERVATAAARAIGEVPGEPSLKALLEAIKPGVLPQPVRKAAAAGIATLKTSKAIEPMLAVYKTDPTLAKEAIDALAATPDMKALDAYLDGLGKADGTVRGNARKAIQSLGSKKVIPIVEARLDTDPLSTVAINELQQAFQKSVPENERTTKLWKYDTKALAPEAFVRYAKTHPGDVNQGKKVFANANIACVKCHRVGEQGQGPDIGPSLVGVGTKYDRQFLIESIVYPSKQILDGYHQTIVRLKDGDVQNGIVRSETDAEVVLFDTGAEKHVIKKTEIASREHGKLSVMPEGLHTALKPEEFADLIAYLESLKEPAKK
ncbi:MAG TPA: PVC-type heme-binding CxxCH protein [Tepidisphaeraceae bacterium]|nr:PVC-type heme-binding CxxCH protein [Tepidisphaeraceae bacterium]